MVMPVEQTCPSCGQRFMGSDAIGDPCPDCTNPDWAPERMVKVESLKRGDQVKVDEAAFMLTKGMRVEVYNPTGTLRMTVSIPAPILMTLHPPQDPDDKDRNAH